MAELDPMSTGEAYVATITFGDDLSAATLAFAVAESPGDVPIITKVHADFDMTNAADGIVRFNFTAADTKTPGQFVGQFRAYYSAVKIIKPPLVRIVIEPAVV